MPSKISHYLLSILCIGCLIFLISHYGVQLYQVSGRSMEPPAIPDLFYWYKNLAFPNRFPVLILSPSAQKLLTTE